MHDHESLSVHSSKTAWCYLQIDYVSIFFLSFGESGGINEESVPDYKFFDGLVWVMVVKVISGLFLPAWHHFFLCPLVLSLNILMMAPYHYYLPCEGQGDFWMKLITWPLMADMNAHSANFHCLSFFHIPA